MGLVDNLQLRCQSRLETEVFAGLVRYTYAMLACSAPLTARIMSRSISTATARCNSTTETTPRGASFSRVKTPSTPASAPHSMRAFCPTRTYGHGCDGNPEA